MYLLLALILIFIAVTIPYTESFLSACTGTDCASCANQSGCSWCEQTKTCMNTQLLKSTDAQCNHLNTISSSFLCDMQPTTSINEPNKEILYKDQIADRVRPPNVYITDDMQYTPETIMGNLNDVRQTLAVYQALCNSA